MKKSLLLTIVCLLMCSTPVMAVETATDSADIDPEMIKENIKKRIEQVVKNQTDLDKPKIAYLGTLSSVTTNSFSLETNQGGVKQASTSAFSSFVDVNNKSKEIKLEDVSLGDYVAALGFLDEETKVLDARRILVLRSAPATPVKKTFFGSLTKIDLKKSVLTVQNPKTSQEKTFTFTSKSDFSAISDASRKTAITAKDVPLNSLVMITFTPKDSGTGETLSTLLVKSNSLATPTPSPTPSPTPKASKK